MLIGIIITICLIYILTRPEPLPFDPVIISNGSLQEVTAIQEQAQEIYNSNPDINPFEPSDSDLTVVDQLFGELEKSPGGQEYPDQVYLAQFIFYMQNLFTSQAKETFDKINPEQLAKDQQALYYNYGGAIYNELGDKDKASEFYNKASMIRFELGGYGG